DDKSYKPKKLKGGGEENLETVSRYLARYATRFGVHGVDFSKEVKPTRQLLHQAGTSAQRLRTLTFVGMRHKGGKASWRCLWNAMMRGAAGTSLRTALAIDRMRKAYETGKLAQEARKDDRKEEAIE